MGFLSKALGAVGGGLNDLFGGSDASATSYKYSAKLNNLNFEQQKWFAQNAHQLEVKDLAKAGLNPALSAGGSGATTGGGGGGGTIGSSANGNIMDVVSNIISKKNETSAVKAQTEFQNAQTAMLYAQLPWVDKEKKSQILNNMMNTFGTYTSARRQQEEIKKLQMGILSQGGTQNKQLFNKLSDVLGMIANPALTINNIIRGGK